MDYEKVQSLVVGFIRPLRMFATNIKSIKGTSVVLYRHEDGYTLEGKISPKAREGVCVIKLPDELFDCDKEDFFINLASFLSIRLTRAVPKIRGNACRDPKAMSEANKKAIAARWAKKNPA